MTGTKNQKLGNGLGDDNGLSWSITYCNVVSGVEFSVSNTDKAILKKLASIVAEFAKQKVQEEKKRLWKKHYALEKTRPLIFCDPELAWYELIPNNQLECEGDLARIWEFKLKKEIYWAKRIKDDRVVEDSFTIHYIYSKTDRGLRQKQIGGEHGGAFRWEPALKNYDDIDNMRFARINVDYEKTQKLLEVAENVFGGILKVKLEGIWWWSLGMTTDLIFLLGFERVLYDFYDNPEGIHRVMSFLRDENLEMLDFLEENNLLTLNNTGDFIGTGGYGWTDELPSAKYDSNKIQTMDMWGFCESQETSSVSAEIFEEFIFPYQLNILERFGLNIYGCCEPLDKRWDVIKKIPRLRKVTVSPWSDSNLMSELLGNDYVFCKKVNPSHIAAATINEEIIRKELRDSFEAASKNGCNIEVLMRDIMTVSHNPDNVTRWVQIAREESEY